MVSWIKSVLVVFTAVLFLPLGVSAQTIVSTSPQNKHAVVEEFGGIYCVYCPHGHQILQSLEEDLGEQLVLINYQTGPYATPIGDDPDLGNDYSALLQEQSQLSGYPAATVNRHVFPGLEQSIPGSTAVGRSNWAEAIGEILPQPAPVNIAAEATLNISTRQLELYIEYYYTGDVAVNTNRLHVAVLQNNVLAPQHGGNAGDYYTHQHLFREFLTGQGGHIITTTSAGTFGSLTYNIDLPVYYRDVWMDPVNIELAIFISNNQQEVLNGVEVVPHLVSDYLSDANLVAVIAPDDTCDPFLSPSIIFRNDGQEVLTSCTVNYGILGGATNSISWSGEVAPLESLTLELDPIATLAGESTNTLYVNLEGPNNYADPTSFNNAREHHFTLAPQVEDSFFQLAIRTDEFGYELYWEVVDESGTILANGGNEVVGETNGGSQIATPSDPGAYSNSTFIIEEFYLPAAGCYELRILDDYGDGLCCYYGNGFYRLRQANGNVLLQGAEFGTLEEKHFTVGSITTYNTLLEDEKAVPRLFPNPLPAGHTLQIVWPDTPPATYEWQLVSVNGAVLEQGDQSRLPQNNQQPAGYYLLQIRYNEQLHTLPFVVQP
ncbi:Omp28-related outer membrane protein [Lewinella sp. LCG006]|uniref:Omp28-related outer membrane protein n=1 Tax=Lewinella sp. LCG006 TaxID=3231911 RepID=UPI003460804D